MDEFAAIFGDLEDPRTGNAKRHELPEILMIALGTLLSGGTSCADMALFGRAKEDFLREFLTLRHGIPSHDTFSRVFRLLDPDPFRRCFLALMRRFAAGTCPGGVVALDGTTLRRSFDRAAASASPLHLVSAWAVEQRLVPGQLAVDGRSNEITAVPQLLALLALEGTIVTADALNGQRAIARQVVERGGAGRRLRAGAEGQPGRAARRRAAVPRRPRHARAVRPRRRRRPRPARGAVGRARRRHRLAAGAPRLAGAGHGWPGLAAVGKVTARREEGGGGVTVRTRYYLLSRAFTPEHLGAVVRAHWDIENGLHWVLDVVLDEDRARNRKDHGPENLALLRRLALNLAELEPSQGSMRGKLKRAGWDNRFLARMLAQFASPQMRSP